MVTHHQQEGHHLKFGYPQIQGRPPAIIRMVTHCPKNMVAYHSKDGHPPTIKWSPTIPGTIITFPSTVTHHLHDGQLDMEFDYSTAQLVNLVFSLAQLVSPS